MMSEFSKIGIMGKPNNPEVRSTIHVLIDFLRELGFEVLIEKACAPILKGIKVALLPEHKIAQHCDLMLVVGGDGSFLRAARNIIGSDVPVIGVNRGRKGFLTDISPQALTEELSPMLQGDYQEEQRFLLHAAIYRRSKCIYDHIGLNDTILYSGHVARMIEYEVYIQETFVSKQRSDGLIIATPTGSTAYALSAGGPILHPQLGAMVIVPMNPHTLSSRPIVVGSETTIQLHLVEEIEFKPRFSFDGQVHLDVQPNDIIKVAQHDKTLRLLHPKSYDYYKTLRGKLGWHNI